MRHLIIFGVFSTCAVLSSFGQKYDTIKTDTGLKYFLTKKGTGSKVKPGWTAIQHYTLYLFNGTKIESSRDSNTPFSFQYPSKGVIKGMNEAISLLNVGDKGTFIMPPNLAYGDNNSDPLIPPNSTLIFEIELLDVREKTLSMELYAALFDQPITAESSPKINEVLNLFESLKTKNFNDLYVGETDINSLGYRLLKKFPLASIEIFKINTQLFPNSANVYDSLGEAYMTIGDKENAIYNYEKSLQLNPKNTNAIGQLNKLKK
jgi:tetratricopeptide (TPR) repeat protein